MTRTLHVRIQSSDRSDLEDRLTAIDAGEDVDPGEPTLSIEDLETFGRVFRSTNLELQEAIVEHEPERIRELARLVDRNPPEVLHNVNELTDYGLIDLENEGSAKRPVVWYDEIDVALPLIHSDVTLLHATTPSQGFHRVVRNSLPPCCHRPRVSARDSPGLRKLAENSYARPYQAPRLAFCEGRS